MMTSVSISSRLDFRSVVAIWRRNFLHFQKSWMLSVFWIFLEPIFIFIAVGMGLGQFVPSVEGLTYSEFFFPGLLATSAMMVSFLVCTYENFSKLTHEQIYRNQLLAPIRPTELYLGEIFWSLSKSSLGFIALTTLGLTFQLISWIQIPALLLVYLLIAFIFSCFGIWVMSKTKNYEQIVYPFSGLIIPMSLFCGTYFPISKMPIFFQGLSYLLPLTHGVQVLRWILSPQQDQTTHHIALAVSAVVLCVFALTCFELGRRAFLKRLKA